MTYSDLVYRDGLQESAVISKTFTVDAPLDDYDDGCSFIESFDSMSTTTATTATSRTTSSASTIKQRPRKSKYNKEHHNHQVSQANWHRDYTILMCICDP